MIIGWTPSLNRRFALCWAADGLVDYINSVFLISCSFARIQRRLETGKQQPPSLCSVYYSSTETAHANFMRRLTDIGLTPL